MQKNTINSWEELVAHNSLSKTDRLWLYIEDTSNIIKPDSMTIRLCNVRDGVVLTGLNTTSFENTLFQTNVYSKCFNQNNLFTQEEVNASIKQSMPLAIKKNQNPSLSKQKHYHEEMQDIRDFIGRSRNTMATQGMKIETIIKQLQDEKKGIAQNLDLENWDEDFAKPEIKSVEERLEESLKLNKEMFEWIKLLDEMDKKQKATKSKSSHKKMTN